jgi:hypothetical protein
MTRRRRRRGQPGGPCSKGWEPRRGKLSRRALRGWSRAGRVLLTTRHRRQLARWAGRARALERAGRSLAHLLLTTHTPSHTTPRLSTYLRACLSFRLSARTRSSLLTALLYLTRRCSFPSVACSPRPPACLPAFADHPPSSQCLPFRRSSGTPRATPTSPLASPSFSVRRPPPSSLPPAARGRRCRASSDGAVARPGLSLTSARPFFADLPAPFCSGSASGYATHGAKSNFWYNSLKAPAYGAPKEAYGIVWPILYAVSGFGSYLIAQNIDATNANTVGAFNPASRESQSARDAGSESSSSARLTDESEPLLRHQPPSSASTSTGSRSPPTLPGRPSSSVSRSRSSPWPTLSP